MSKSNKFEVITKTAIEPKATWSNKEIVAFHYFNPNGLIAAKETTDKHISALVDAGIAKSGAIMAYGSLNYFYTDKLRNLFNKKAVNGVDLQITLQGIRRDIETAKEFIAEKTN